jgi:hypothetical protein
MESAHPGQGEGDLMVNRPARRGNATVVFLVALPVLVFVFLMVLHTGQLEQSRGELQQVADAAALAGAHTLVDDATLLHDGGRAMPELLQRCRAEASRLARANPVLGVPTELEPNDENAGDGDIVFGIGDSPSQGAPLVADLKQLDQLHFINTVHVTAVRSRARGNALSLLGGTWLNGRSSDLTRTATAFLDRAVIGFRQVGDRPIPLVPIALLSDRGEEYSWEQQVEMGRGSDVFRYERDPYRVIFDETRGDGLREMVVRLRGKRPDSGDGQPTNSLLLQFGTQTGTDLARQVREGLRTEDLRSLGGELVLGADNRLPVPGSILGPSPDSVAFSQVRAALQALCDLGEIRAWPLFDPHATEERDVPILCGFVAARVLAVEADRNGLKFVLQPTSMSSVCVVTRTGPEAALSPRNPYLCRVRLVN